MEKRASSVQWIRVVTDHKHTFDDQFGVCACGAWEDHFNCECGAKTIPAYDGNDKCMGCGKPFEAEDVLHGDADSAGQWIRSSVNHELD